MSPGKPHDDAGEVDVSLIHRMHRLAVADAFIAGQAPGSHTDATAAVGGREAGPGALVVRVRLPLRLAAVGNRREHHFARARRTSREIGAVLDALTGHTPPELPVTIELHRVDWNPLDPDGLVGALKCALDAVAQWLCVDDRDRRLHWRLSQGTTRETRMVRYGRGGMSVRREPASSLAIVIRPWRACDGRDALRVALTPKPKSRPSRRERSRS